jgi:hypothetical protein
MSQACNFCGLELAGPHSDETDIKLCWSGQDCMDRLDKFKHWTIQTGKLESVCCYKPVLEELLRLLDSEYCTMERVRSIILDSLYERQDG